MRRILLVVSWSWLLLAAGLGGCAELPETRGLELQPPKMANDSVVLEVFLVRLPAGDATDTTAIWAEIDELALSAETREQLGKQGFRAGVTAGRIPVELERLLQLGEKSPATSNDTVVTDFQHESNVSRRILQMRAGKRGEIMASRQHERLTLFDRGEGQVTGQTYSQAQCCFAVSGAPRPDGNVRLEVASEVQHGNPRVHYPPGEGSWMIETRRPRVPLDDLKIEVQLRPGQILLLGGTESADGSLGSYFFADETSSGTVRRLVLIRLAQSQHEGLFTPDDRP